MTRWEMLERSSNHNKNSYKSMFVPLAERSAYLGFEAEQRYSMQMYLF